MSIQAMSLLQMGALLTECVTCQVEMVYSPEFDYKLKELGMSLRLDPQIARLLICRLVVPPMGLQNITHSLDRHFKTMLDLGEGGRFYIDQLSENTCALYLLQSVATMGLEVAASRTRRRSRNRTRGRQRSRERQVQAKRDRLAVCLREGNYEEAVRLRDELRQFDAPDPEDSAA